MRSSLRVFFLMVLLVTISSMMPQKITRIVFFGDSITAEGVKPAGFITLVEQAIEARGQKNLYDLVGAGIGGNTVTDLYLRLEDDVLSKNPDIVFIWIGVNDVWHKSSSGTGTDADKFEKFYMAIIQKMQAKNIKVILCTPATIGEKIDFTNQQDGDLNLYAQIIRDLSKNYNCGLIDFREIFHVYNLKNNPGNKDRGSLTRDGVHLNEQGNRLVADKITESLFAK